MVTTHKVPQSMDGNGLPKLCWVEIIFLSFIFLTFDLFKLTVTCLIIAYQHECNFFIKSMNTICLNCLSKVHLM